MNTVVAVNKGTHGTLEETFFVTLHLVFHPMLKETTDTSLLP